MDVKRRYFLTAVLTLALLAGCGQGDGAAGASPDPAEADGGVRTSEGAEETLLVACETPAYVTCRIADGAETGDLLLAELDYTLYGGHDGSHDGKSVYRLTVGDNIPVYLDGEEASAADLRDGMPVEIAFNGAVAETFPAQLGEVYSLSACSVGTRQSPGGSFYDLCGFYLRVLDDLWNVDSGLNSRISTAGLDLSRVPGDLLDSEKAAIAWRFGELHDVEVVTGTFDELAEQGCFTQVASGKAPEGGENPIYEWEDGCLFSIMANNDHEGEMYSLPVLFFDAQKWRSGTGAYYFCGCSAVWPESGTWSGYTVGSEAIS